MASSKNKIGKSREEQAADYLQKLGYRVLERNFTVNRKEIDIIALDTTQDELVFVEVKFRKNTKFGQPSQAVNFKKLRHIQQAALIYLDRLEIEKDFRFDIISITPKKVEHLKNVSWQI